MGCRVDFGPNRIPHEDGAEAPVTILHDVVSSAWEKDEEASTS